MAEQIQKAMPVFMLSTRDSLQIQGHTQNESKMMERDTSWKWEMTRKQGWQNSYQTK